MGMRRGKHFPFISTDPTVSVKNDPWEKRSTLGRKNIADLFIEIQFYLPFPLPVEICHWTYGEKWQFG